MASRKQFRCSNAVLCSLGRAVKNFVSSCPICQKVKADHHLPRGYLQALLLPVTKWETVAMDWVVGLPPTVRFGTRFDAVLLVTDRATKMCHLIPTYKTVTAKETAAQFLHFIVKYHGLPSGSPSAKAWTSRSGTLRPSTLRQMDKLNALTKQ